MSDDLTVEVFQDGPFKITNCRSVSFGGETLPTDEEVYLCRCGQSANAPFCDGSHEAVGFDGAKQTTSTKDIKVWEGRTIKTFFNPNTCMHAFACKPLNALREAELAGDDAAAAEIIKVIDQCPSGALTWESASTAPPLPTPDTDILIMEGGEIRVQVPFQIDEPLNEKQRDARATLCRCGLSRNKPWCDGRHKKREDFR